MTDIIIPGTDVLFNSVLKIWLILMMAVILITFIVSEITRNYSQVDKLWSLLPVAYSWITVSFYPSLRMFIMAVLVTVWGLRLSYNFWRKGGYSLIPWMGEEDYRWKILREGKALKGRIRFGIFNFLFISLFQNIVIFMFSSPLLLAALSNETAVNGTDLIAGLMMLVFILTEAFSDNQLFRFHQEKKNAEKGLKRYPDSVKKGFMTEGLWKYSRHPNFASEQAVWISFYLFGVASSGRWINLTIAGPLLLLLIFAGSSRLTESISSRKYPEYLLYQKKVPRFIPGLNMFQSNTEDKEK